MFELTNMVPGTTASRCITVTYSSGAATADVVLYGAASGELAPYLDLTVEFENGATNTFANCTGFLADGTAYSGTVAGFAASHTNFGSGAGSWSVANGDTRVYRFTATLQDDNAAQGKAASASFTWEAQTN